MHKLLSSIKIKCQYCPIASSGIVIGGALRSLQYRLLEFRTLGNALLDARYMKHK